MFTMKTYHKRMQIATNFLFCLCRMILSYTWDLSDMKALLYPHICCKKDYIDRADRIKTPSIKTIFGQEREIQRNYFSCGKLT